MEKITFKGTPVHTYGKLPKVGSQAPCFTLTRSDLTELYCHDLKGRRIVLNIFPSLDTSVCATSVRKFNELAASLDNTTVVAVSKDLPFLFHSLISSCLHKIIREQIYRLEKKEESPQAFLN